MNINKFYRSICHNKTGLVRHSTLLVFVLIMGYLAGGSNEAPAPNDAEGSVWVLSRADRSVTVIDARQAEVVARINLGFRSDPADLVYWDGAVWVGSSGGMLQRIDAETRRLMETIPLNMDVWSVSAADHGIYAMDGERSLVSRHDTGTGELLNMLDPPDRIHAMAAGPEEIAVITGDRGEVHFYSPGSTQSRVVRAELGGGDMVLGFDSFWIYHPDGRLLRVDPASGGIQAEVELEPDLYFPGISVGDNAVWIAVSEQNEIIRIDPATNRVSERIPVDGEPAHAAVQAGFLWVALSQDDTVVRIDPSSGTETARIRVRDYPLRVIAVP